MAYLLVQQNHVPSQRCRIVYNAILSEEKNLASWNVVFSLVFYNSISEKLAFSLHLNFFLQFFHRSFKMTISIIFSITEKPKYMQLA